MFCKYCGNRLEDGDRFCGACGHPVEEKPMQETANEDSYKKQEEKVPRIKKKKPEPEYDNRMTEGMGYGYQMEQHRCFLGTPCQLSSHNHQNRTNKLRDVSRPDQ